MKSLAGGHDHIEIWNYFASLNLSRKVTSKADLEGALNAHHCLIDENHGPSPLVTALALTLAPVAWSWPIRYIQTTRLRIAADNDCHARVSPHNRFSMDISGNWPKSHCDSNRRLALKPPMSKQMEHSRESPDRSVARLD
jgi:hypothetical protein